MNYRSVHLADLFPSLQVEDSKMKMMRRRRRRRRRRKKKRTKIVKVQVMGAPSQL
jgi:hypothetical protein